MSRASVCGTRSTVISQDRMLAPAIISITTPVVMPVRTSVRYRKAQVISR